MVDETQPSPDTQQSNGWLKKTLLLAVVAGVGGTLYWLLRDVLSLAYLASQEAQMRAWQVDFPMITAIVALAVYVAVAGLSLPGASVLTLVCGWYFGFWEGLAGRQLWVHRRGDGCLFYQSIPTARLDSKQDARATWSFQRSV